MTTPRPRPEVDAVLAQAEVERLRMEVYYAIGNDHPAVNLQDAVATLDRILAENARLTREVGELRAERDEWGANLTEAIDGTRAVSALCAANVATRDRLLTEAATVMRMLLEPNDNPHATHTLFTLARATLRAIEEAHILPTAGKGSG